MNIDEAKGIVVRAIMEILEEDCEITGDTELIGGDSLLDSMKLVEICVLLEDVADDHGFEFDWTSDEAMSKSRSMFRTVTSLAQEFSIQSGS